MMALIDGHADKCRTDHADGLKKEPTMTAAAHELAAMFEQSKREQQQRIDEVVTEFDGQPADSAAVRPLSGENPTVDRRGPVYSSIPSRRSGGGLPAHRVSCSALAGPSGARSEGGRRDGGGLPARVITPGYCMPSTVKERYFANLSPTVARSSLNSAVFR
jgi:hypothetical protein